MGTIYGILLFLAAAAGSVAAYRLWERRSSGQEAVTTVLPPPPVTRPPGSLPEPAPPTGEPSAESGSVEPVTPEPAVQPSPPVVSQEPSGSAEPSSDAGAIAPPPTTQPVIPDPWSDESESTAPPADLTTAESMAESTAPQTAPSDLEPGEVPLCETANDIPGDEPDFLLDSIHPIPMNVDLTEPPKMPFMDASDLLDFDDAGIATATLSLDSSSASVAAALETESAETWAESPSNPFLDESAVLGWIDLDAPTAPASLDSPSAVASELLPAESAPAVAAGTSPAPAVAPVSSAQLEVAATVGASALSQKLDTLGRSGQIQQVAYLIRYANHADREVRATVASALGNLAANRQGSQIETVVNILGKLSQDLKPEVRLQAVQALGKTRSATALSWLQQAQRSPDSTISKAATAALQQLKPIYQAAKPAPAAKPNLNPKQPE